MQVGWMMPADLSLASYRYRCMIPMRELKKIGVKCELGEGQVMVFNKHFMGNELELAKQVKSQGGKVVFDVCDNHFDTRAEFYTKMVHLADAVTCPTQGMQDCIKQHTGREADIIGDPYEYPMRIAPQHVKTENVLWFGHQSNLGSIRRVMDKLGDRNLIVVTGQEVKGAKTIKWSREAMMHAFVWANVVILPVDLNEKTQGKSPNRLVESVRQGLYVVSEPLESYKPYGMWQGDIIEGLDWVDAHPEEAREELITAQELVFAWNDPAVIAQQWFKVFKKCLSPHTQN